MCKFSNRVLIIRVESLCLEPLLDLVAHGREVQGRYRGGDGDGRVDVGDLLKVIADWGCIE